MVRKAPRLFGEKVMEERIAERFAKDFDLKYDKIKIKNGYVTYRVEGDSDFYGKEGATTVTIGQWFILRHYELMEGKS